MEGLTDLIQDHIQDNVDLTEILSKLPIDECNKIGSILENTDNELNKIVNSYEVVAKIYRARWVCLEFRMATHQK